MTTIEENARKWAEYRSIALTLAAEAGQVAAGNFGEIEARRKRDGSLVTAIDELIDRNIAQALRSTYPEHAILSEEQATLYDPAFEFTWVVDPIDGTTNYARGVPLWGVSIALLWNGDPVMGVINFPLVHEVFSAIKGGGAWCNDRPITTAHAIEADDEQLMMRCTRTERLFELKTPLKARILGSAAYHLCKVADGTALVGIEATPMVWDLAASVLIVTEAGGIVETALGAPIFPLPAARQDYLGRTERGWHAA